MGGHWIKMGLPHYVAIDCKPEKNRCEIVQNTADSVSGIMLNLKVMKTADHKHLLQVHEDDRGFIHGTVVLRHLKGLG